MELKLIPAKTGNGIRIIPVQTGNKIKFHPKHEMELEIILAKTGNGIRINFSPNRKWNFENVHKLKN